jgi:ATP-dependent DNA helicase RecG
VPARGAPTPVPPADSAEARPVTALKGVGAALAQKLTRLGVASVQDLLFLLPLRYEDRTRIVPVGSLRPGDRAVVEGEIELAEVVFRRKRQLLVRVADGSGFITLRFFHFSAAQQAQLSRGVRLRLYGEVRRGTLGLEIVHPEYRRAEGFDAQRVADSLTPVYPATEGVQQGRLRILTALALEAVDQRAVRDWLPGPLVADLGLPQLAQALATVHRPAPDDDLGALMRGLHPAQRRLAFEELLAHELSLKVLRREIRADPAWPLPSDGPLLARLRASLPFSLTAAQARVHAEIAADLSRTSPMLRLVQGDVGSGKTVVAALAAAAAVDAGRQAALMAPTELLAEQHAQNFEQWFAPLGLSVRLISGRITGRARVNALDQVARGEVAITVGTQALFQEGVRFANLALVIIDEQHRFGVHQRLALRDKGVHAGRAPHQLIMTATPIPRTLAMTAYADLDLSVIDQLPPGRQPVQTVVMPESRRAEVVRRIAAACRAGRQAYWVCPLIDESEELGYQAAEATHAQLAQVLPGVTLGLLHGRLKPARKEAVMAQFKRGAFDLLVATSVIEVGVDVPNASLLVVENAERMGLAQLHQLRGRVGRGSSESTCVLMYRAPLSPLARERLSVLRNTSDGFEVARRDLALRGPGELLGTRQTGLLELKVAELSRDADLLPRVHQSSEVMLAEYPANIPPLLERWIGARASYGRV